MDAHVQQQSDNDTAFRILRIREAFAEARHQARLQGGEAVDPPQDEPVSQFKDFDNFHDWHEFHTFELTPA